MRHRCFASVGFVLLLSGVGCSQRAACPIVATPAERPATVRVGGIVLKWVLGEKALNYQRAEPLIRQATAQGAQIVVTTECFLDGYAIRDKKMAVEKWRSLTESIPDGEYVQRLSKLAAELKIYLVAGLVEATNGATYNTAILLAPDGSLAGKYHKQDLGHELWRNTPGSESPVFDTRFGRIGLIICADRLIPDIVGKIAQRADLVICPSGGMWGPKKNDSHLQDRSRENHVPIVFVHPTEFLVTGANGAILDRRFSGDKMSLDKKEIGGDKDARLVAIYDVPLR